MSLIGSHMAMMAGGAAGLTYDTWNPADKGTLIVLSGGNLGLSNSLTGTGTWNSVRSLHAVSTGKNYAESKDNDATGYGFGGAFGVCTSAASLTAELGSDVNGWGFYGKRQDTLHPLMEHSGAITNFNTMANGILGSIMQVAYDAAAGKVWFGQNGVWAGGGDPATGTTPTFTVTPGTALFLGGAAQNVRMTSVLNTGATAFGQTVPSGFTGRWAI
jgi:hypothetical protein